jgi:hypothetical protein
MLVTLCTTLTSHAGGPSILVRTGTASSMSTWELLLIMATEMTRPCGQLYAVSLWNATWFWTCNNVQRCASYKHAIRVGAYVDCLMAQPGENKITKRFIYKEEGHSWEADRNSDLRLRNLRDNYYVHTSPSLDRTLKIVNSISHTYNLIL